MSKYKPWPTPKDDWPSYVKEQYEAGCKRIDELRKQIGDDGVIPIPFQCYSCDKMKSDYALTTGDGVPMCEQCIRNITAILEKVEV